jgi:hypothetical protein
MIGLAPTLDLSIRQPGIADPLTRNLHLACVDDPHSRRGAALTSLGFLLEFTQINMRHFDVHVDAIQQRA